MARKWLGTLLITGGALLAAPPTDAAVPEVATAAVATTVVADCVLCRCLDEFGEGCEEQCADWEPGWQGFADCDTDLICDPYCAPEECCMHCQAWGACSEFASTPFVSPTGRFLPPPNYVAVTFEGRMAVRCTGYLIAEAPDIAMDPVLDRLTI